MLKTHVTRLKCDSDRLLFLSQQVCTTEVIYTWMFPYRMTAAFQVRFFTLYIVLEGKGVCNWVLQGFQNALLIVRIKCFSLLCHYGLFAPEHACDVGHSHLTSECLFSLLLSFTCPAYIPAPPMSVFTQSPVLLPLS